MDWFLCFLGVLPENSETKLFLLWCSINGQHWLIQLYAGYLQHWFVALNLIVTKNQVSWVVSSIEVNPSRLKGVKTTRCLSLSFCRVLGTQFWWLTHEQRDVFGIMIRLRQACQPCRAVPKKPRQSCCWLPWGMEPGSGLWSSPMQPTMGFLSSQCGAGITGTVTQHQRHQNTKKKKSGLQEIPFFLRKFAVAEDLCPLTSHSAHPFWVPVTFRVALTASSTTSLSWAPFGEPGQVSGLYSLRTTSQVPISDCTCPHTYLNSEER